MSINYFQHLASILTTGGYLPVPITPGKKACEVKDWVNYRFTETDADRYAGFGVGLLCGQGKYPLIAIDCDTRDQKFLSWLKNELVELGPLVRVGNAPKILYLFRAEKAGQAKLTSSKYKDKEGGEHQLEILGCGQQFVAFGIHPNTGKPYQWTDSFGGPTKLRADCLPIISNEMIEDLIEKFNEYGRRMGWELASKGGTKSAAAEVDAAEMVIAKGQRPDISLEQVQKLLQELPQSDVDERSRWVETGMALHFHFDGSTEAYQLWDAWSRKSPKYKDAEETQYLWSGFGRGAHRPVTIATIIARANEAKEKALREAKRAELAVELDKIKSCLDKYEVQSVLKKTSLTDSMDKEEFVKAAQDKVLKLTGLRPSVASIRGYLPKKRRIRKYEFTEDGNAQRFVDRYADSLRYVVETGDWLMWSGCYWEQTSEVEAVELARQTVLAIADEARECESDELRSDLFAFCAQSQRAAMYRHIVEIARGDDRIRIHANALDAQTRYVAVQNGEIDLKTLRFIPPEQTHYLTQVMGVKFNPDADCPLWKKTVLEVCSGDEEKAEFYQLISSYPILGEPIEQKFFTLQGGGANGKSTLTNTILHVYGQFGLITPSETLLGQSTNSNAGQTREDLLRLKGKRLVTVMEPDDDKPLKEGTIKALTGGEMIAARGLYAKKTVSFKPQFTLHFCTNHDLLIRGTDHGILRRTVIMSFDRVFQDDEQDKSLTEKLKDEGSGILNWILEGVRKYREKGLSIPTSVKDSTERYKESQDLLKEWLEECFEFGPGFAIATTSAFQSWKSYAEPRGLFGYIKNTRSLSKKLSGKGFRSFQHQWGIRGRGFSGLRLKEFTNLDESE